MLRTSLVGLLAVAVVALLGDAIAAQSPRNAIALVGGRILPSPNAPAIDNGTILIRDGKIAAAGPASRVNVPAGATTIDCKGLYIVAGFQNSHIHFTEPKWTDAATLPAARLTQQLEEMLTSHGFTTVVDTGSSPPDTTALRRRIAAGEVIGPRIITAGLPLYPPEGVPYYVYESGVPAELIAQLPQPTTAAAAIAAVDQDIDAGADIIKLFTGSWITTQRVLPMPVDIATAAVRAAHRRGRLVFAHTSSLAGLEVTLPAGVDVIAHALDDPRGLTREHLQRMKGQNVALIPTLTLFARTSNAAEIFREVADYAALGGEILYGTDAGYHQVYESRIELDALAKAGLTWQQILASLTTAPAHRFGESARRGQLSVGMDGDVVVLGADPAVDPRALADVRYTISRGRVLFQQGKNAF